MGSTVAWSGTNKLLNTADEIADAKAVGDALALKANSADVHNVPSGGGAGQVLRKASATDYDVEWYTPSGGGGGGIDPYDSNPAALGTASPGVSAYYSRGDHVHQMPSASDVGAVAVAQGVAHAGEFVVVGSDGNITTVTMATWQGGNY